METCAITCQFGAINQHFGAIILKVVQSLPFLVQ
jgi:hypothetical protein